ncbi:MAG: hypothetical protein QF814_08010 [Candidatus Marinimicrobia bacterium]|jgi:hypothetical protein|nr:hypothetical protein [Candidatus Neomarinimicrobiota bacterium]|tara:strand:- start:82 stop:240 length:159 start_codon:yes stop_codon:yes gene_type:complete
MYWIYIWTGRGYALDFDGSNDYSIIFDNNTLEFDLSFFTVEFWIGKLGLAQE